MIELKPYYLFRKLRNGDDSEKYMPVSGQHLLISSENEEKMQHAKTDAFGRIRLIADGEEADATYLYGVSKGTRKAVMIGDQHVQSALLFSSEEGEDAESWRKSVAHALVREEECECKAYNIDTRRRS